ncbi:MAG: arsenite methyltransferase [Candidatus Omnitrophica bacterium]|nr:arsenite methyltransferase [Candidatus Omnitrophota bacterium]
MKRQPDAIKKIVREGYARAVKQAASCCSAGSCCGSANKAKDIGKAVGYSDAEMNAVPEGANLGFGCGNPVALASLREGDIVLDLGSGAGFDAFLASRGVGKTGRVIGVDMTPEMVDKAKENAVKGGYSNVEFRLGEIEKLPVEDSSIDVIISNCVINLSPEKDRVFRESFRVLKPGGRLMVSDLVLAKELPDAVKESVEAYVGCLAGAIMKEEYLSLIKKAGFRDAEVIGESSYPVEGMAVEGSVASIKVIAKKAF